MSAVGEAALISQMEPPAGEDREFDAWYEHDHVPARMVLPGFRGAVRAWAVEGGPPHLVVYFMDDLATLATPVYKELKRDASATTKHMLANVRAFTRWPGELVADSGPADGGRFIEVVAFELPEGELPEFDRWHDGERMPALMGDSRVLRCRRYAIAPGGDPAGVTRVVLHEASAVEPFAAAAPGWEAGSRRAVYERHQDFDARH